MKRKKCVYLIIFAVLLLLVSCKQNPDVLQPMGNANTENFTAPPVVQTPPVTQTAGSAGSNDTQQSDIATPNATPSANDLAVTNSTPQTPEISDDEPIRITMPPYIELWYTDKYKLDELYIFEISETKVSFAMGIYRNTTVTATAKIDGDIYRFSITGPPVSGRLELQECSILVTIDESDVEYLKAGTTYAFVVKSEDGISD